MNKDVGTNKSKKIIAATGFILLFIGLFFLTTTSAPSALSRYGDSFYYLKRQILNGVIPGLILGFLAFKAPLQKLRKLTPYLLGCNILLLALLFLPYFGAMLGGSKRWLKIGPISFQPTELLKVTFILYFAHFASKVIKKSEYRRLFISFIVLMSVIGFLTVAQPDLSTLGVIVAIGLAMYFSAGMPLGNILLIATSTAALFWCMARFSPYRLTRVLTFFDPSSAPLAAGYQIKQMLYAIGSGGLFGLGLGLSRQKFGFLPHSISDSIFAIIAEESGFVGAIVLIALFTFLSWMIFRLALSESSLFQKLIIVGVGTWIAAQTFVHIAANIGLIPLTGMPLPFISYGGSALTAQLIGLGLMLNGSKK
jgi:cell division protein FtsW